MTRPDPDDYGFDIHEYVLKLEEYCDWLEQWNDATEEAMDLLWKGLTKAG